MPRRLSTEEFIEKAKAVHGDRYDYSSVSYANAHTKVTIICDHHGPFSQTPDSHVAKHGCPDCGGRKQLTNESFIQKAVAVHSDRYDYSQVEYVNILTPVTIICPDHGPFDQLPQNHYLVGSGCPDCAGTKRLTNEPFIEKARAVHGDQYDYSSAVYVNSKTKLTVICPNHGPFHQTPTKHLSGSGCPDCGGNKPLTTDSFIEKAIAVHGDRYDYSGVEYVNAKTKVAIACRDHGTYYQSPSNHLSGRGCRKCQRNRRLNTEAFIQRALAIHGDRYDYSQVTYVDHSTNVTIICPDHGPFEQTPNNHFSKKGCLDCGGRKQLTNESFIQKAVAVHGDRYDYSQVEYVNILTPVTIICPEHGPFDQLPQNHYLVGSGCPDCADTGFNPNDRAVLYYIAIETDDGDTRYKIGITNRTVQERFHGQDLASIRIVKTWQYAIGREAAEREAELLRQHSGDTYNGPDILLLAGNTELFTHDVLGLDTGD